MTLAIQCTKIINNKVRVQLFTTTKKATKSCLKRRNLIILSGQLIWNLLNMVGLCSLWNNLVRVESISMNVKANTIQLFTESKYHSNLQTNILTEKKFQKC